MSNRKLINDIHKLHKKVQEGVTDFSDLYEKALATVNNAQMQKLEQDMKKEIKKLQRFRDQLKTWINSNEIKDKTSLLEDRKLIELQMEKFKSIEKELKTKAFSKEGLLMKIGKTDPKLIKKEETSQLIKNFVDLIEQQIEKFELEIEISKSKKTSMKNLNEPNSLKNIENRINIHKKHLLKLELILRLLENDKLDPDSILSVTDQVEYYIDCNQEPYFVEDDTIYDELDLEKEDELLFSIGLEDNAAVYEDSTKDIKVASQAQIQPVKEVKNKHNTSSITAKKSTSETKSSLNNNEGMASAPITSESSRRSTISKPSKATEENIPDIKILNEQAMLNNNMQNVKLTAEIENTHKKETTPKCLEEMLITFNTLKDQSAGFDLEYYTKMIELSYRNIPEAFESQDPKYYIPIEPLCYTPQYYPQIPYYQIENNEEKFEKLDLDTLFFIFYYEQSTYQQYLAVKELKKRAWRFHKKYLTWFQRHDEPKIVEKDFEMGTYIFFDYESSWCKRKKSEFEFNYEYLEDTDLE